MNPAFAVLYILVVIGSVFAAYNLARSYTRLKAVEHGRPGLWTVGRFIGITAGTLVWMMFRILPPDLTGARWTVALIGWNLIMSFVLVVILDLVLEWLFIDEPSYGASREVYLRHESGGFESDDWIDALYGGDSQ